MIRTAALVALVLAAAACTSSGGGSDDEGGAAGDAEAPPAEADAPPYEVAMEVETFVDPSRPTAAEGGNPGAPDRTLETHLYFPADAEGPFPLIAFAHGLDGHPRKFSELFEAWAAAGYVVASPAFPLTNDEIAGDVFVGDFTNQPADLSFVVDEVLALSGDTDGPLAGLVDEDRIGAGGLSLGSSTAYAVSYHSCCRDDRIRATVIMSTLFAPFDGTYDVSGTPLLILHSEGDPALAHEASAEVFALAAPPKFFVTLLSDAHAAPFEDAPDPTSEAVRDITTTFWDTYLAGDGDPEAVDGLVGVAVVEGLTTLDAEHP